MCVRKNSVGSRTIAGVGGGFRLRVSSISSRGTFGSSMVRCPRFAIGGLGRRGVESHLIDDGADPVTPVTGRGVFLPPARPRMAKADPAVAAKQDSRVAVVGMVAWAVSAHLRSPFDEFRMTTNGSRLPWREEPTRTIFGAL